MSSMSLHKEICPKCGKEQMVEKYDSLNNYDEEMFAKIVDGTIFDYKCEKCEKNIHAPHPLLFHKMGIQDVQIGYKISPMQSMFRSTNPIVIAVKEAMKSAGKESEDIMERYEDEEEFRNRVGEFLKKQISNTPRF